MGRRQGAARAGEMDLRVPGKAPWAPRRREPAREPVRLRPARALWTARRLRAPFISSFRDGTSMSLPTPILWSISMPAALEYTCLSAMS